MKKLILFFLIALVAACDGREEKENFEGFWEGPHPEIKSKKFYIHISSDMDTIHAQAYWTENNFYQSHFAVENVIIAADSISFFVPLWDCVYKGCLKGGDVIEGGFYCKGDPFDSVNLLKNDRMGDYLIYPKPGCHDPEYLYIYQSPEKLGDGINTSA
jgi:hypothetical protein